MHLLNINNIFLLPIELREPYVVPGREQNPGRQRLEVSALDVFLSGSQKSILKLKISIARGRPSRQVSPGYGADKFIVALCFGLFLLNAAAVW
jgi:hypothetical protein